MFRMMIRSQGDVDRHEPQAGRPGFEPVGPPQQRGLEPRPGVTRLFDVLPHLEVLNRSTYAFPNRLVVEVAVRNPHCTHLQWNEDSETKLQIWYFLAT